MQRVRFLVPIGSVRVGHGQVGVVPAEQAGRGAGRRGPAGRRSWPLEGVERVMRGALLALQRR